MRLDAKTAALEHDVAITLIDARLNELNSTTLELKAIKKDVDQKSDLARSAIRNYGEGHPISKAVAAALDAFKQNVADQQQKTEQRLDEARSEIAKLPKSVQPEVDRFLENSIGSHVEQEELTAKVNEMERENERFQLRMKTADGVDKELALNDIVRAYPANQLSTGQRFAVYLDRWREFFLDDPREANSEGGVFPAIWGTAAMTLIMSVAVVPFGVLAALYLREYAKSGPIISAVRISINNLAGVPSIVFGVFGLAFFIYTVGKYVDGGPEYAGFTVWPGPTWFIGVTTLVVTGIAGFFFSMWSFQRQKTSSSQLQKSAGNIAFVLWIASFVVFVVLIAKCPYFDGFFAAHAPNPKFAKGGLLWASLTLALMTLPVVIVATEEALAAVPNSMREGSYACGASKWQTIKRIVLPRAMPGIMTGMILAMARGAGEVAPLMLVGAVKLAPELPVDMAMPFVHADRSFMHLGFHIYDLGFASQNSEAAKPMVYTTTLLLIGMIALLNLAAIWMRARLRKRFSVGQF